MIRVPAVPALRALADLLVPSRCAGCQRDGPALCARCSALLGPPRRIRLAGELPPVFALGRYHGPLRSVLLAYKERGRRELAGPLGAAVAGGMRGLAGSACGGSACGGSAGGAPGRGGGVWLVPVPSRPAAARRRGGDHVLRLAERAAEVLAAGGTTVAVAPGLRLARGARDSVGLDAAARAANLAGRMLPRPAGLPPPATAAVLLDDVATTGATAAACTAALAAAGVEVAAVLVLASAAMLARSGVLRDQPVTLRGGCRPWGSLRA